MLYQFIVFKVYFWHTNCRKSGNLYVKNTLLSSITVPYTNNAWIVDALNFVSPQQVSHCVVGEDLNTCYRQHWACCTMERFYKIFLVVVLVIEAVKDISTRFTDLGSILVEGKIMNTPVFYHEVNMVLWALSSNV